MEPNDTDQYRRAGHVYLWFLVNLSVLPVIAFVVLLIKHRALSQDDGFLRTHTVQTLVASVVAGGLLALSTQILSWIRT